MKKIIFEKLEVIEMNHILAGEGVPPAPAVMKSGCQCSYEIAEGPKCWASELNDESDQ